MFRKAFLAVAVFVGLLFAAASAFATVGQYQIVSVTEGEQVVTYLLDTDSGDVWQMKELKSGGEMKSYFLRLQRFNKEKEISKWERDMEGKSEPKMEGGL